MRDELEIRGCGGCGELGGAIGGLCWLLDSDDFALTLGVHGVSTQVLAEGLDDGMGGLEVAAHVAKGIAVDVDAATIDARGAFRRFGLLDGDDLSLALREHGVGAQHLRKGLDHGWGGAETAAGGAEGVGTGCITLILGLLDGDDLALAFRKNSIGAQVLRKGLDDGRGMVEA